MSDGVLKNRNDGAQSPVNKGRDREPDRISKLFNVVGTTISRYGMIGEGDHILVGVSGGKDSYVLLQVLSQLQRRAPVRFKLSAFHLDGGWSGDQARSVAGEMETRWPQVPIWFDSAPIAQLAPAKTTGGENTLCSFCARMRRGIIYSWALKLGCNKVALGHHRDDMVETLLMNMCFNGTIKGMPAILQSSRGPVLIRPMIGVWEDQIRYYGEKLGIPFRTCDHYCVGGGDSRRKWAKELLARLDAEDPGIKATLASSAGRVMPGYLLGHGLVR